MPMAANSKAPRNLSSLSRRRASAATLSSGVLAAERKEKARRDASHLESLYSLSAAMRRW
jgi:hypothetical protein